MVADNERLASVIHWPMFQLTGRPMLVSQIETRDFALAIQQFYEYTCGLPAQTYRGLTAVQVG